MLTAEQKRFAFLAPCNPLSFLVSPTPRSKQVGMDAFSDSAYFHRMHDLFWTFREPSVLEMLTDDEQVALANFESAFSALPWQECDVENHFYHLPDDDLSSLIEPGKRLLQLLEARSSKRSWLSRLWGRNSSYSTTR
jgi:hypothetical protein